jgi:hypothetical protein
VFGDFAHSQKLDLGYKSQVCMVMLVTITIARIIVNNARCVLSSIEPFDCQTIKAGSASLSGHARS